MSVRTHLISSITAILLAILILTAVDAAPKGTISGTVRDAATGEPLPSATLIVSELRRGTISSAIGEFLIEDISPGIYTVRTRRVGYVPSEDTLTVAEGEAAILTVRMVPEPIPMEPVEVKAPRTVRQRVNDASEDAESYAYREGRSRAPIDREDGEWLSLAARAIREGQYELAQSYAAEVGYEVDRYTEQDLDREYIVLQEQEGGNRGWGTFLYHSDYRFVNVIVQRIIPDFTGAAVQNIASSVFEELGARALLICGAETSGWGSDTSPFKCVLDEWGDEKTLLVQIVGVEPRPEELDTLESQKTHAMITDNQFHPPDEEATLIPPLVWDALRMFRRAGFGVPLPDQAASLGNEDQIARSIAGYAGLSARRVGQEEQLSYSASMYTLEVRSFGVVIRGEALKKTMKGLIQARLIKDTLTKFLIQQVLSGLTAQELAEASGMFQKSRTKFSASETPNLVKMLVDPKLQTTIRQGIMEDLLYAGAASIPPLVEALVEAREYPHVRENAMELLASIGTPAVNALVVLLKNKDEDVRRRATWALQQIGDDRAAFPLMALLKDRNLEIRREAILGLGTVRSREAVPLLLEHLPRADLETRRAIVWSLGEIGDPGAISPLRARLRDSDGILRRGAAESLSKIVAQNPEHLDILMDGARSEDPLVRVESVIALGQHRNVATMDTLLSLTQDNHAEVRHAAAKALGDLGDLRATPVLMDLLDDGR